MDLLLKEEYVVISTVSECTSQSKVVEEARLLLIGLVRA